MKRALRKLALAFLWTGICVGALVTSAVLHVGLPITRRVVSGALSDLVSNEIRGALIITKLETMSLGRIVAHNALLFDGKGRLIIEGKHLVLTPDLSALPEIRFSSARLTGANVHLFDDGDGLPSLLTTFDAQIPSPSTGDAPLHVVIDGIVLSHANIDGDLLGLNGFRAVGVTANGQLDIGEDVRVRIDRAQGTLVEPFGYPAVIDSLTGTISTVSTEGVALYTKAHRDNERAVARVAYVAPQENQPQELSIDIDGQAVSAGTAHGLGFGFVPDLELPVSGHLALRGPPEDLAIQGQLSTEAGNATLRGSIAEARGVSIELRTDGLELARLMSDYPKVTARGLLRIDAEPGDASIPRVHAEVEPLLYGKVAVPGFQADGAFTDDGVRIDSLRAQSAAAKISGRGRLYKDGGFEFDAHASLPEISREPNLHRYLPEARGRLEADVQMKSLKAGLATVTLQGKLVLIDASYGLVSAKRIEVRGSAHGDPEHPRLRLTVKGEQVRLGEYLLGDPTLALKGGPREYQAEGEFVSAGKRTFNLNAKVVAQPDGFVIDADPIEFAVGQDSWRGALLGLRVVNDQSVELGMLRLANRSQRLEARGMVRFHGDDQLTAQLQDFDLAAVNALLGDRFFLKQGRADASVELQGDLANPNLQVQGALREGVFREIRDINALYFLTYKDGRIEADGEIDCAARGLLRLSGSGHIDRSLPDPVQALLLGTYDLELTAERLSFSLLPASMRADVLGSVGGSIHVTGTPQNPNVQGEFELSDLTFPGVNPLTIWVSGSYRGDDVRARIAVSDRHGPLLGADARMQLAWSALRNDSETFKRALLAGPWEMSGTTTERRLDQLPAPLNEQVPYPIAIATNFDLRKRDGSTSGTIAFDASSKELMEDACGASTAVRVTGRLALDQDVSNIEAGLLLGQQSIATLQLELGTPVDTWVAQGYATRPTSLRATALANVADIAQLPYLCEYGTGTLRANITLQGGLSSQPKLTAQVDASFLPRGIQREGRRNIPVRSCDGNPMRLEFAVSADAKTLVTSSRLNGCGGGATTLSGSLPVQWDGLGVLPAFRSEAPVSLLARFEGAQLKPLLDRIAGVLNADALARGVVNVTGTMAKPRFSGQVAVEKGRLYLIATGQELTDIRTNISFHGNWARIVRLEAKQGTGTLAAAGGVAFEGFWPRRARIALKADSLPIKREGLELAWLTGSAAIDADIAPERLRAAIKLHSLKVVLPEQLNRTLQPLDAHPDVAIATDAPDVILEPYPLELVIDASRGIKIRRDDFEATITTKIAANYENPNLRLAGTIQFRDGNFSVFGKRFDIDNGRLHFHGETDLNPDVYLLATQRPETAGAYPVTVLVTGTLQEPVVTFSSDACPGEVGALTYLISGQCAADDPNMAQESEDAQNAFTTGVVSGVLTLGTAGREIAGLQPRVAFEDASDGSERVKVGVASESLVPKFMRGFVRRVYVQGGVTTASDTAVAADQAQTEETASASLDFLIELYFAYNIVASGRFGQETWGLDVLWEP